MSKLPTHKKHIATVPREIEYAFIGAILIEERKLHFVISKIDESHFHYTECRYVFTVIKELFELRGAANVMSVSSEIYERRETSKGGALLLNLGEPVITDWEFQDYYMRIIAAKRVRDFAQGLIDASDRVLTDGLSLVQREQVMADELGKLLDLMPDGEEEHKSAHDFAIHAAESFARAERGEVKQKQKTGIVSFDSQFGGLVPGRVSIIGGRPSHGKTSFATYLAVSQCKKWKKHGVNAQVLYFSAEMSHDEMSYRVLSALSGINGEKIGEGACEEHERSKINSALEEMLTTVRIAVDTNAAPTVSHMKAQAMRENARIPVKLIIFDYLEYSGEQAHSEDLRLAKALKGCHAIAKTIDCPVVVLSQLGRVADSRDRPALSDFRYTGFAEQVAALAAFVYYPYKHRLQRGQPEPMLEDREAYEILVRKNTHGPCGDMDLKFYEKTGTFIDPVAEQIRRGDVIR